MKSNIVKKLLSVLLLTILFSYFQKTQFSVQAGDFVEGRCRFWPAVQNSPPRNNDATFTATGFLVYQEKEGKKCYFPGSCIQGDKEINIVVEGLNFNDPKNEWNFTPKKVSFVLQKIKGSGSVERAWDKSANINNGAASVSQNFGNKGKYRAVVFFNEVVVGGSLSCSIKQSMFFIASESCDPNSCSTTPSDPTNPTEGLYDLCLMQIGDSQPDALAHCLDCFESKGIWTAVGCIPKEPKQIVSTIIEIGLIISGAIVLITILAGAFMLSTSQGDPKKTQEAKELITSAIIGLLFVIFSITILQFIGVSVLKIPGFGE